MAAEQDPVIRRTNEHFAIDIKKMVDQSVVNFISSIPGIIERHLEKLMWASLGFDKRWDEFELRDGNHIISEWIGKEVQKSLRKQLKEIKGAEITLSNKMRGQIKKEFVDRYRHRLMSEVESLAEQMATEDAIEFVKNLAPDIDQIRINLDPSREDVSDPGYGKLRLEAKALERLLEKEEEEDEDE